MGTSESVTNIHTLDVIVVGAGFAGLYALHRMRQQGLNIRVLERGPEVGGTWYWNRYPGARCDVESLEYSYKFDEQLQQEWVWSERYAMQPEILRYLNHVADRFDLRSGIEFGTDVISARFEARNQTWHVETQGGLHYVARYLIAATGCLSVPNRPSYPGQERFKGQIAYTSGWPQEGVNFAGKRVAVIGTGSSGIQSIPIIAEQAQQLTVFQRTPNFSVPARNRPLSADEVEKTKADYPRIREHNLAQAYAFNLYPGSKGACEVSVDELNNAFEARWNAFGGLQFLGAYSDLLLSDEANRLAADFIRRKIRQIVKSPGVAEKLIPKDHAVGCKRLCSDTGYYETFNRSNVDLVDIRAENISEVTETGIRFGARSCAADVIVFATGFDAMTGALLNMNISGKDGAKLSDAWDHGAQTYLGLMAAGFPNLFMVTGPGSPSVLSNMVMSIEDHVDWIANCIAHLESEGMTAIEADEASQESWMIETTTIAAHTQFSKCNSWYHGSNIDGKPRAFLAYFGFSDYRKRIAKVAEDGYAGFRMFREKIAA